MEYFYNNNNQYDFIVRTNISTVFNIPKLFEVLSSPLFTSVKDIYTGQIAPIDTDNRHVNFALGTCIILSKSVFEEMVLKKHLLRYDIVDDVAIGMFMGDYMPHAYNDQLTMWPHVFYSNKLPKGYDTTISDFKDFVIENKIKGKNIFNDYIAYRNSTRWRDNDYKILCYIVEGLYYLNFETDFLI